MKTTISETKAIDWKKKQLIKKCVKDRSVIFLTNGEFTEDGFSGMVVHADGKDKLEVGTYYPTISFANAELFNGTVHIEG